MNLLILSLLCIGVLIDTKEKFPKSDLCNLVDRPGSYLGNIAMVTKKVYNKEKRCGANGTGNAQLKIIYQNGGNAHRAIGPG